MMSKFFLGYDMQEINIMNVLIVFFSLTNKARNRAELTI